MKIEIHNQFESRLPANDAHPYRSGAWRPQCIEYDAFDLDVIEGEIPDDLAGTYLRNTENPLLPAIERYHPFDGDGMLHSISFAGGGAQYHNRFVPTDGFRAERETGEHLFAGLGESPDVAKSKCRLGARPNTKDASSTDIVVHNGLALSSFYLCGDLYAFDPVTLDARGKAGFAETLGEAGVSAHTKVDENSGELMFFNYGPEPPFMHYGLVDAKGTLAHYIDVPLPGPRLPHDIAFTKNHVIVNDCPLFWDPDALKAGHYLPRYYPELPTRFGIFPRRGSASDILWFEAEPTFVLHWVNAYEDGDDIVLDGFFQEQPSPPRIKDGTVEQNLFRYLDLHTMRSRLHRWRFNLKTGQTSETRLSERTQEFGMINGRYGGRPYRYAYNALPAEGWFGFVGITKHDLATGREEVLELPEGVYASETVMAPRSDSTAEDDGYLVTFTMDVINDASECLILDASQPCAEPVARVALPERIASGTHAYWHPTA